LPQSAALYAKVASLIQLAYFEMTASGVANLSPEEHQALSAVGEGHEFP
jgi:hypothetical protein